MELSRFILILSVFFINFHGIFLSDIPSTSSKRDIATENPQRNLQEDGNNYIILYFNQNCEYPKGFKNNYRNDISIVKQRYDNYILNELNASEGMTLYKDAEIEIHFARPTKTLERFFDVTYDKNMEFVENINFNYFDSSEVENMNYMFTGCKALKSIKFRDFSTGKVTTMNSVFLKCISLTSLDLSSFSTWNVKDTSSMFQNCISLAYLDISNFNTENVDKDDSMFDNLDNIQFLNLKYYKDKGIDYYDILQIEDQMEDKRGLVICRNKYTLPLDYFIYCCDYLFEKKLCLEKKIILQYILTVLLIMEEIFGMKIEIE